MRKNKLLTIFAVLVFAFLIIPLIIITVTAFGGGNAITFPIESFSMKWPARSPAYTGILNDSTRNW